MTFMTWCWYGSYALYPSAFCQDFVNAKVIGTDWAGWDGDGFVGWVDSLNLSIYSTIPMWFSSGKHVRLLECGQPQLHPVANS